MLKIWSQKKHHKKLKASRFAKKGSDLTSRGGLKATSNEQDLKKAERLAKIADRKQTDEQQSDKNKK